MFLLIKIRIKFKLRHIDKVVWSSDSKNKKLPSKNNFMSFIQNVFK